MEPPYQWPELCVENGAQDHRVGCKCEIIKPYSRLNSDGMSGRILRSNGGRVEKCGSVNRVTDKA